MTIDEIRKMAEEKGNRLSVKDFTKKKYEWIMAIDPDVDRSGCCLLRINDPQNPDPKDTVIWAGTYTFPQLVDRFTNGALHIGVNEVLIVIEGGWLNTKSCFHEAQGRRAERVAKNVGANQQTGKLLAEMAEHIGYKVEIVKPLVKTGSGHDRKLTTEDLKMFIPNMPHNRLNQDARDAIRLAWHVAGFSEDNNKQLIKKICRNGEEGK